MRIRTFWVAIFGYVVLGHALPAVAQVDQQRAQAYFKEVQALCERDGGRLWGVSLCGPMVIGDMRTQTFATSQPAPEGARPRLVGLVNAPVQWGVWPPARCVVARLDAQGARHRRPRHARDACARCSTSH
jgi:hypothetical protein